MNYTNVKRVNGHFSIANKNEAERLGIEICDKCAIRDSCKIRKSVTHSKVIAPIKLCKVMQPYISFSVLDGLNSKRFNTFRVYTAWARRLKIGDKVHIHNSKEDTVIDIRKVQAIFSGDKNQMLQEHAKFNHVCLDKSLEDPASYLEKTLIKSMGKNFYNASKEMSVIYF